MKTTIKYGITTAIIIIILMLVEYMMEWDKSLLMRNVGFLSLVILAIGVYYGIKSKRDNEQFGYIDYSDALWSGFIISLWVGAITGIFSYFYSKNINPDLANAIIKEKQELMSKINVSPEKIAKRILWLKKEYSPKGQMILSFGASAILGLVFSVIFSVFLHRKAE